MAKVADDDDDLSNGDEDETLTELQKEYESEDSIGKCIQNPQFCQAAWQNVSQSPARQSPQRLKEKLERKTAKV